MDERSSYEVSQASESNAAMRSTVLEPPQVVSVTVSLPADIINGSSPPYTLSQTHHHIPVRSLGDDIPPPKADFSAPPPYDLATKLPTYEEVQREKSLQGELPLPMTRNHRTQTLAFLAIDTESGDSDGENGLLGTDFMFYTAFFIAFLFNWVGFLLLMCFCHTVAARYGALAGFGLSLAKWTLIVKHSTDLASHENSWLWWLIMAFGLLICVRATLQYLNIKRGWRLLSGTAQERLLFFY
uniref:NEDD4 family-interacting protein 1-like n=1 Tax=Clastoptera arizonana TaxID=38151 RepID=A0A1B6CSF8_9HEMI